MELNVLTDKKEYEIVRVLEANKNVKMDSYYIIKFQNKKEQNTILVERGVSTGYPASTKWRVDITDNNVIAKEGKTFNQFISLTLALLYFVLANMVFAAVLVLSLASIIKGNVNDIPMNGMILIFLMEIFSVIVMSGYKYIYCKKPKEVLERYLKKILVED